LERLSPSAVETLIRRLARKTIPALSRALITHTDGNPFFLVAALQALFEEGTLHVDEDGRWSHAGIEITVPVTVQAMIEARLQRLDREQRHVLDAITVIGQDFDFPLLARIVEMNETPLFNTLDTLLESGLVIEPRVRSRGEFAPAHDLYVEVARASLPRVRWRRLNGRVADALQEMRPDDPAISARLARHYYEADRPRDAVSQVIVAGEIALNRYAVRQARSHFESAAQWAEGADWTPEPSMQTRLHTGWAEALRRSGHPDAALSHYAQALSLAEGVVKLQLIYQIAALQTTQGESPEAFTRLTETVETGFDEPETLALLRCSQGFWAALRGEPTRARRCAAEGWQQLRHMQHKDGTPPWLIRRATIILARTHALWGEWRHARRYAEKALRLNTANQDAYGAADARVTLAQAHFGIGETDEARTHAEQALEAAEEAGDLRLQGKALYHLGQTLLDERRGPETQQVIRRMLDIAEQTEDLEAYARGQLIRAQLMIASGMGKTVRSLLEALLAKARAAGAPSYIVLTLRMLTEAHLILDAPADARSTVDEALTLAKRCRMQHELTRLERLKSQIDNV
jgi:tetratricopeptide (TPR) repeat protein